MRVRVATLLGSLAAASLSSTTALGQTAAPTAAATPAPTPKRYMLTPFGATPFECIANEAGLPSREVSAIAQDKEGYLWFGTQDGLARYDGYAMSPYRFGSDEKHSISSPIVTSLAADEGGLVWIGTDAGLDVYDTRTHEIAHYREDPQNPNGIAGKRVTALLVDSKGQVWVGTDAGLNRYDPAAKAFTRYPVKEPATAGALPTADVLALYEGRGGHLWIGTGVGVSEYDPGKNEFKHYANNPDDPKTIGGGPVVALTQDGDGQIWLGTAGEGVSRIDPASGKVTRFRHDPSVGTTIIQDDVLSMRSDREGRIWVGTNGGGLSRVDPKSGKAKSFPPDPDTPLALPRGHVLSIFQDRGGVLWFGTLGAGACKLDPFRMNFPLYLTRPGVGPIVEDGKGVLWLGSHSGLQRFDRSTGEVKSYVNDPNDPATIGPGTVWTVKLDRSGSLWLGVAGTGIEHFDPKTETFKHFQVDPENPRALRSDLVFAIDEDQKGHLWVGTWGAGLALLDRANGQFTYFDTGDGKDKAKISSNFIYTIKEDRTNAKILWIGTGSGGLSKLDTDNATFTQYPTPPEGPSAASFDVMSIHQDQKGVLWLGTHAHGLLTLDPAVGKLERHKAGPNAPIYGILEDSKGRLWLTTTIGLYRLDPATGASFKFDTTDGLQGLEFTQNGYGKSARSGEFFVGGPNGLNIFKPEDIRLDEDIPPVAVQRFSIMGKDVDLPARLRSDGAIDLSYFDRMVSIEFAALAFGAPGKQQYAYRLKGLHDDWIAAPTRTVSYSNLDGGDYVLEVKAANRHGVWNEKGLALKVHVSPAPWKTWWAYLGYGLIALTVAGAYVRTQRRRVKNLEQKNRLQLVEKDLELMSAVQLWFLPRTDRLTERHVKFKAFYRSAEACSGDWWWYERLPDGSLWILVGDVTGHGAAPAVLTAAVATACRIQRSSPVPMSIEARLQHLNQQVFEVCEGRYFLALSSIVIPPAASSIQALTAGGLPPIVARRDGQIEPVRSIPSTPLGNETFSISETTRSLSPGDRLLLLTDGLIEAEAPDGSQFGLRRLRHVLEELKDHELETASELLVARVDEFRGPHRQTDDMTFVLLEVPE